MQSDLQSALRQGARSIASAGRRVRDALVVVEVALAVVLLVGAGLLGRSFVKLQHVSPGFEVSGVLQFTVTAPNDLPPDQRAQFFHTIEGAIAAVPGARSVGSSSIAPFNGGSTNTQFLAEGHDDRQSEYFAADWRTVTPGFFGTMGISLVQGRLIAESDAYGNPRVAVIDETMAARLWPGQNPLGKHIMSAQGTRQASDQIEVIGVVRDIRDQSLAATPGPAVYIAEKQKPWIQMTFFVRGGGEVESPAFVNAVRRAFREAAPTTPVPGITLVTTSLEAALAPQRFTAGLLAGFAAVALILAAIGLYSVIAFGVAQRTTEIGVRLAFGATSGRVVRMVMRDASIMVAVGLVLGCFAAGGLSRLISSLLFATASTDSLTYAGVVTVLLTVAAAASYLPARRAARTDPLVAMRER